MLSEGFRNAYRYKRARKEEQSDPGDDPHGDCLHLCLLGYVIHALGHAFHSFSGQLSFLRKEFTGLHATILKDTIQLQGVSIVINPNCSSFDLPELCDRL